MTCTGTTCNQGRAPCSDGCNKPRRTCAELGVCQNRTPPCDATCLPILSRRNRDDLESNHPWDWIDNLSCPADRALLVFCAAAIVVIARWIFF